MPNNKAKSISVIIPTYNESVHLPKLLSYLSATEGSECISEVIVSDGQSTDNTVTLARGFSVRVIAGDRGRAKQLNSGAMHATGAILYFLHADSIPPSNFVRQIFEAQAKGSEAGCFRLRFDWDHWFLRLNAWFTRFNINALRFGDQSLFMTKKLFDKIGGFREDYELLEDQEIVYRVSKHAKFMVLPEYITTSARKYRINGAYRMQGIFIYIYFAHFFGASQQTLKKLYQKLIRLQN
jgi:rSAM/selenodomain-associated transferase 2